jgi:hypothetical protein
MRRGVVMRGTLILEEARPQTSSDLALKARTMQTDSSDSARYMAGNLRPAASCAPTASTRQEKR